MVAVYFVLSGVSVLLWVPILLRFYRNWVKRHNPISLAICATLLLLIWIAIAGIWTVMGDVRKEMVSFTTTGMSALIASYTHFTFYRAEKKFQEAGDPRDG